MKKVLAIHGSHRNAGNSAILLQSFMDGIHEQGAEGEVIRSPELALKDCQGCLRCNVLRRCSISGDGWTGLSEKIMAADVLVFASPVYFHHVPASVKRIMDRFRSFVHVQITEKGLIHTPWNEWKKDFVLILSQGSPDVADAEPVIDLFRFMSSILGEGNRLHVITATRLAVVKQVIRSEQELAELYIKMKLPLELVAGDYRRNQSLIQECKKLGKELSSET